MVISWKQIWVVGFCPDVDELISFKSGMFIVTIRLISVEPFLITLTCIQGHSNLK